MSETSSTSNSLVVKKIAGGTQWQGADIYVSAPKKTIVDFNEWNVRDAYIERSQSSVHKLPLDTNMAGRNSKERAAEFNLLRKRKPKLKRVLNHIIISAADFVRELTDTEWKLIGRKFIEYSKYINCDYITERHWDTKHQHIHLLISRITRNGQVVSDSHDYIRHSSAIERITSEFGLLPTESIEASYLQNYSNSTSSTVHRAKRRSDRRKTPDPVIDINAVKNAIRNSCSKSELSLFLFKLNIEIEFSTSGISGLSNGWKLRNIGAEEWVKGSSLSRDMSWPKVNSLLIKNRLQYVDQTEYVEPLTPRP